MDNTQTRIAEYHTLFYILFVFYMKDCNIKPTPSDDGQISMFYDYITKDINLSASLNESGIRCETDLKDALISAADE